MKFSKLIRFRFLFFVVCCLLFAISPMPTLAHVLQTDGSIGVVLHVSPDDDPYAKVPTDFFVEITDKEKKFSLENCNCFIEITKGSEVIFNQQFSTSSLDHAGLFYTFPEKNIYTVTIKGSPKTENTFQAFSISFDQRVARETSEGTETNTTFLPVIVFGIFIIITIGAVIIMVRKKTNG